MIWNECEKGEAFARKWRSEIWPHSCSLGATKINEWRHGVSVAEFVIVVALSERVSVESGIDVAGKVAVSQ